MLAQGSAGEARGESKREQMPLAAPFARSALVMSSTLSTKKAKKFTTRSAQKKPAAAAAASSKKKGATPKRKEPAAAASSKKKKAPKKQKTEETERPKGGVWEVEKILDHNVNEDGVTEFTVKFKKSDETEDMTAWQLYKTARKVFADYLKEQKLLEHLVS